MIGKNAAQIIAKIVMVSASLLMPLLHLCLNSSKMAEIKVPAWPIPIHQTKFMIAKPHPTDLLTPHSPMPNHSVLTVKNAPATSKTTETQKPQYHNAEGLRTNNVAYSKDMSGLPDFMLTHFLFQVKNRW
jgi:hypothetical protein